MCVIGNADAVRAFNQHKISRSVYSTVS